MCHKTANIAIQFCVVLDAEPSSGGRKRKATSPVRSSQRGKRGKKKTNETVSLIVNLQVEGHKI